MVVFAVACVAGGHVLPKRFIFSDTKRRSNGAREYEYVPVGLQQNHPVGLLVRLGWCEHALVCVGALSLSSRACLLEVGNDHVASNVECGCW